MNRFAAVGLAALLTWPWGRAAAAGDQTYEQLKMLVDVLNLIEDNYVDEPDLQKLVAGAAAGMMRTLDPYSQYLSPEDHREVRTETEGQFGGIGIRLSVKDDWLTVVTPLPGTPAYRAGVLPNDRVVEIDGQSTKDMDLGDALRRLRGAPGTKVSMTLLRGPEDEGDGAWSSLTVPLTREVVKIESVQSWMLEGGVGYARIVEFSGKTADDARKALGSLIRQGASGLILDLRNNPGGLLSAAVDVSSFFLSDNKLVVFTKGRKADSRQEFRAGGKAPYPDIPLVVLINEGSASGAEIVAGALQDHRRALILGGRSFGKGSVQSVIPLADDSGLRLTVARYYTPSGRSIHRDEKYKSGGITPDIAVRVPPETEAKLYAQWDLVYARGRRPRPAVKKDDVVRDEALERAAELIRARDVLSRLQAPR